MLSTRPIHRPTATIAAWLLRTLLVLALAAGLLYSPMSPDARTTTRSPTACQMRIYNPTGWQNTMAAAADAWNRTGVTPTLVFTSRHADADVVVEASTRMLDQRCDEDYECDGYAERYGSGGRITLRDADPDLDRYPSAGTVRLAAHELGHILGLRHEMRDCALMNTDTGDQRCSPRTGFAGSRGPMGTDIAAAQRLYNRGLHSDHRSACALGIRPTTVSARSWVGRERPRARQY